MCCARHFKVSHWLGELLLPVWNDWAPLAVPWSQRFSESSPILGAGGGPGTFCDGGSNQFHSRALCAATTLASVL